MSGNVVELQSWDGTNVNAIHIPDYVSTSIFIKRELNNSSITFRMLALHYNCGCTSCKT